MQNFSRAIESAQSVLLTTHVVPDGDGIGSQFALFHYLIDRGKKVIIQNADPIPRKFHWLDPEKVASCYDPAKGLPTVDLVCVLDTHDWKMLGPMGDALQKSSVPVFFVDHHVPAPGFSGSAYIDESQGSTGELIFEYLKQSKANITVDISSALYVSLLTDARTFRFKGMSANYHEVSAKLIRLGANPLLIQKRIYSRDSPQKLKLLGHTVEKLQIDDKKEIVWVSVSRLDLAGYGASIEDTESYIDSLTQMEGVEVAALFREDESDRIKVSLRALGESPVLPIAENFGGGGHEFAAGMRIVGKLEEVMKEVIEFTRNYLSKR